MELCKEHGYAFADVLPAWDRTEMLMSTGPDGKKVVKPYPVVKLRIPGDSSLGAKILLVGQVDHAASVAAASEPSPAHDRENALFVELCKEHGYAFADVLPARDRTEMLMSTGPDGKKVVKPYPVVKLRIPGDSSLGAKILDMRKKAKR